MIDQTKAKRPVDRRAFVRSVGGVAGGAWLSLHFAACQDAAEQAREAAASGSDFSILTAEEGRQLEAVCATLIPSGETPGAREAGAAHFIDTVLGSFEAGSLPTVREGLEALAERVRDEHGVTFADLDTEQQVAVLTQVEEDDPGFFGTVRYLTICGTFCHPDLGGNRDRAGWTLLGMDVQNAYQPPFGYYDRGHHGDEVGP
ncbi:MAG: gluconate 2-dehydrogenase subunit 3 family protein [Gemmatimonadetes bacterium]|nr:gluconate 2-dehydrogenase subunit 3 family protein [Gemmatimonadota bacterium]